MHPDHGGGETTGSLRRRGETCDHIAAADVGLVVESKHDRLRGMSLSEIAIPGGDGANPAAYFGGQRDNLVAGANAARGDLAGEAPEILIGADHTLDRKTKVALRALGCKWDRLEKFEKARSAVPGSPGAAVHDVVAREGADGNRDQFRNFKDGGESEQVATVLFENFFGEVDQIHLVDGGDHRRDAEQRGDAGMPARLIEDAFTRVDQDDGNIGRGSPGSHIARVLLVAGRVGDDEFSLRRREIAVGDIDGDALLARMCGEVPHIGGMQQRLGGNAADVQAGAAEAGVVVKERHLQSQLRAADSRCVAGRPAANDNEIVVHKEYLP